MFSYTRRTLHVCMFTRHTESIFIGEEDKNGRADNHQVVAGSRIRRRRRNGQLQPDTSMETTPKQSVETRDTLMILVEYRMKCKKNHPKTPILTLEDRLQCLQCCIDICFCVVEDTILYWLESYPVEYFILNVLIV